MPRRQITPLTEPLEPRRLLAATPLADLFTGENADHFGAVRTSAAVNGAIFFGVTNSTRYDPQGTIELWHSRGTPETTTLLRTFDPDGATYPDNPPPISNLTDVNGTLFFTLFPGERSSSAELWKSDGTPEGTVFIKDLDVAPSQPRSLNLFNADGTLYFFVSSLGVATRLWKSDGTTAGTHAVSDDPMYVPTSGAVPMTYFNGALYFTSNGLWKTDGTDAGTVLVKSLLTSDTGAIVQLDGRLYFNASGKLYASDGTPEGTLPVTPDQVSGVRTVVAAGPALYFPAATQEHGLELWKSDGTTAGTTLVRDINRTSFGAHSTPANLTSLDDGTLIFTADDRVHGTEMWRTDGTEAGTELLYDFRPGSSSSDVSSLARVGDEIFFAATSDTHGRELWRTDGTPTGLALVQDTYPTVGGSYPRDLVPIGDRLFYHAIHPENGFSLFTTDGTPASTYPLKDLKPGPLNADTSHAVGPDGRLYLVAGDVTPVGRELYALDPLTRSLVLVRDVRPGVGVSSAPAELINVNGTLYFAATTSVQGRELWKSDGTAAGTLLVADLFPFADADPTRLVDLNGVLYFVASSDHFAPVLWRSDGTAAGTTSVKQSFSPSQPLTGGNESVVLNNTLYVDSGGGLWRVTGATGSPVVSGPAPIPMDVWDLTNVGGALYFGAATGTGTTATGNELWTSDGTSAGTRLVKDINPGYQTFPGGTTLTNSNPMGFVKVGNAVFFSANDGQLGRELWRTDGTAAGTYLVKDILPNPPHIFATGSQPMPLAGLDGKLLFLADDGIHGTELWTSDGTPDGTSLLLDIRPDPSGQRNPPRPYPFTVLDGRLYFTADDGAHGVELWVTDGTPAGTRLAADVNPGPASSAPSNLFTHEGDLHFTANDGVSPRLFKLAGPQLELRDSYFVSPEWQVTLDATGGVTPEGATTFAWDLDADGLFGETGPAAARGDETGAVATFSSAGLTPGIYDVALRAADSLGLATVATTTVSVGPPPGVTTSDAARYDLSGTPSAPMFTLARGHAAVGRALTDSLADLAIHVAADASITLSPSAEGRYRLRALTLEPTAFFDIFDNDLILAAPSAERDALMAALAAHVHAGRVGASAPPAYTGVALFPSRPDEDTILVKHTYNGDANADGRINADDYFRIDQAFLAQPISRTYAQGDFNYDGRVNADDYFMIDQAFLGQGASLTGGGDSSPLLPTRTTVEDARPRRAKRARPTPRVFD